MAGTDTVVTGLGIAMSGVDSPAALLCPAEVTADDPAARLTGRGLRYKDRATRLALGAAADALTAAGLLGPAATAGDGERGAVVVSSNLGNVDTVCETVDLIAARTSAATSPMSLPSAASNVIASWLAIRFGLTGPGLTLCNGPTSGLDAVHWARLLIAAGRAGRVLVVGVEPDTPAGRRLVSAVPFDGAAALVLESSALSAARGAAGSAVVGGYCRAATPAEAVAEVGGSGVGLWCAAEPPPGAAATLDLTARFGECSGALGVLQCVAGISWLAGGGGGDVLALAAGGDASAALRLTAVPSVHDRS
ncbi:beta-ketoacyl synthase N-terminal-like domain-containing protein [Amycolatopsis samaneae]|uniref:Beta-ketoacyl synthase N-terminal-like domain-containing protein n=1 Tax=Amycolatopsis samaneae TaxID=664691 RepID=A0ABW5GPD2_9PSEU